MILKFSPLILILIALQSLYAKQDYFTFSGNIGISNNLVIPSSSSNNYFLYQVFNQVMDSKDKQYIFFNKTDTDTLISPTANTFSRSWMLYILPSIQLGVFKNFGWEDDYIYIGVRGSFVPDILSKTNTLEGEVVNKFDQANPNTFNFHQDFKMNIYALTFVFGGNPNIYSKHPKLAKNPWDLSVGAGFALQQILYNQSKISGTISSTYKSLISNNLDNPYNTASYGFTISFMAKYLIPKFSTQSLDPYIFLKLNSYAFMASSFPLMFEGTLGMGLNINFG